MEKPEINCLIQKALIDLYLIVKVRTIEELENYNENKKKEERESLSSTNSLMLIDYIKESIEILLNMNEEENALIKAKKYNTRKSSYEIPIIYDEQLQKFEEEIRSHIRASLIRLTKQIEQQMQLQMDMMNENQEEQNKKITELILQLKVYYELSQLIKRSTLELENVIKTKEAENKRLSDTIIELESQAAKNSKFWQQCDPFKQELELNTLRQGPVLKGTISERNLRNNNEKPKTTLIPSVNNPSIKKVQYVNLRKLGTGLHNSLSVGKLQGNYRKPNYSMIGQSLSISNVKSNQNSLIDIR